MGGDGADDAAAAPSAVDAGVAGGNSDLLASIKCLDDVCVNCKIVFMCCKCWVIHAVST